MKKIIYSLSLCLLSGIFVSCGDFLDVKPVGKMIPTEIEEYENLLNNINTIRYFMSDNNNGCFYAAMGDNVEISENLLNYQFLATSPNLEILAAYKFYSPVLTPSSTPYTWQYPYQAIGYFNNVIDGITNLKNDTEYAKNVIAEARAARAWVYMNMALTYGPMFDPAGNNDTKVIPLRISGDPTDGNGDLATTKSIFEQVKADLDYACEHCPLSVVNPSRVNKACAYALRAEYYMYTRDWQNMLADSKKALELTMQVKGSHENIIYNFKDFYYAGSSSLKDPDGASPETEMTFRGPDTDFALTRNRENLLYRQAPVSNGVNRYYPSEDWKQIFDKEHDLRWRLFALRYAGFSKKVSGVLHSDGIRIVYFRDKNLSTSEAVTYPLLMLMIAEAEARVGNTANALSYLNTLRRFRYDYGTGSTDLANGSTMSQDQLLTEILTERRREQPLATFQRTLDLKRYALDAGKPWSKSVITHQCGDKKWSKSITDSYYQTLPIDNVILKYNPQWGISENTTVYDPVGAN